MRDPFPRHPADETAPRPDRRPTVAAWIVLALLGLVPVLFVRGTGDAFEPPKAALLTTGMFLLFARLASREIGRAAALGPGRAFPSVAVRVWAGLRSSPIGASVLLFLASAALSTATSMRRDLSLLGAPGRPAGLLTACATASVFFASRSLARTPRWIERLATVASLAAAVAAAYALLQLAGLDPVDWVWTATFDGRRRVPGTLGHPNHLGTYLAMSLPLALLLAKRARARVARAGWALLLGVEIFVLATTLSRGAWVAAAAGVATLGALSLLSARSGRFPPQETLPSAPPPAPAAPPRRRLGWTLAALALAVAAFSLPLLTPMGSSLLTRVREIADLRAESTQTRFQLWRAGLEMFADRPVLGVGTDAFVAAYPRYRTPESWRLEWNSTSTKVHDELIQIAATQGALGLLAGLLVVGCVAWRLLRLARDPDGATRGAAATVGAALAAWAVSNLASFTVVATGTLAAALAGWADGMAPAARATESAEAGAPAPRAAGSGEAGALAPCVKGPPLRVPLPARALGALLAAALWIPLVLTPWRASHAAAGGLGLPLESPDRERALERASSMAPWDERYATELGRTLMARSFAAPGPDRAWSDLARARSAFERAVRIAPESAEDRALLARTLAAQVSLRPDPAAAREAVVELRRARAADSTGPAVLELTAQGYLDLGLHAEAHESALRCARLYPTFAHPMADLGLLALEQRRYADAADTLGLAARRDWHEDRVAQATAEGNLAFALLVVGRDLEAWQEADRAVRLIPTLEQARRVREEAALRLRAGVGRAAPTPSAARSAAPR